MSTAFGATRHIRGQARRGLIPTPGITGQRRAALTTTRRPDEPRSPAAVPTPISIRAIPPAFAAARPTIRTPALLLVAERDMPGTSTPDKARRTAAASSTTPIPEPVSRAGRTTFTRAKTERYTATTATQAIGP